MSCGEGVERGAATCVCKGQTVFEGAVIGQVFTGDVQMQCPHAEHRFAQTETERAPTGTGRHLSNALIALAIWQATKPEAVVADSCGTSLTHAGILFFVGVLTRYLKPLAARFIRQLIGDISTESKR